MNRHNRLYTTRLLLTATLSLFVAIAGAQTEALTARLDSLMGDRLFETSQIGLMVYDLDADSVFYSRNARQLMRPASCMKLVTAITALDRLGGSYSYETRIYYTGTISQGVLHGNIYCVGGFDPTLTKDDVTVMAERVVAMGVDSLAGNIIADRTMKDDNDYGEGWCWDDDNPILTPLTIGRKDTFLPVFAHELRQMGIALGDTQLEHSGVTPSNAKLVCVYRHSIDDILMRMMKNSDNFYAESMFYQTAAASGKRPCKADDARRITRQLIMKTGLNDSQYRIADGSGLSLYNYVSAELLVRLLRYAYKRPEIYAHLLQSLPVAGIDGTIKKRMTKGNSLGNVCAKTGTLTGISSLAGYLATADGKHMCFAIINQGIMRSADGRNFQDRVCSALCE